MLSHTRCVSSLLSMMQVLTVEQMMPVVGTSAVPKNVSAMVKNNAGGVYNHLLFFKVTATISPGCMQTPALEFSYPALGGQRVQVMADLRVARMDLSQIPARHADVLDLCIAGSIVPVEVPAMHARPARKSSSKRWRMQDVCLAICNLHEPPSNATAAARGASTGGKSSSCFVQILAPANPATNATNNSAIPPPLGPAINQAFGNYSVFKKNFTEAALSVFGSGAPVVAEMAQVSFSSCQHR